MATSAEIAQQISDQQNWFYQQNAMAQQVGANPQAFGGMGGWGVAMPSSPAMQPAPGQGMPGAFSFGYPGGYGAGNRLQAFGAAGLSAVPHIGQALGATSPLFNPAIGFSMARGAGMGIGAAAGAGALMAAPMAIAGWGVGQAVRGMQQNSMVQTAISDYSHTNPASMSGQGFSRQDAMAITRNVRQLSYLPELMTSFEEVTRMLPQLKQIGVMQGVRDAAEFSRRMKEAIGTVRQVSQVIGGTMEEATAFFAHSRSVGFFGRQDQLKNAMNAQQTMAVTGMNQQQFMQMQQTAAGFGTAIGGSRGLATQGVTEMASRIGLMLQGNPGLAQSIQNMTGKDPSQGGIQDLAMQMLTRGQSMAGTGVGRFLMLGAMKMGPNGQASIDEGLMNAAATGGMSLDALRNRGSHMAGNRDAVFSFLNNQTKLGQQFTAQGGQALMFNFLRKQVGDQGAQYLMQTQYGMSEEQAQFVHDTADEEMTGMGAQRRMVSEMVGRNARRRMNGPGGLGKRMGVAFHKNISGPLEDAGSHLASYAAEWVDEVLTDIRDDAVIQATEQGKKDLAEALGSADPRKALRSWGAGNKVTATSSDMALNWKDAAAMGLGMTGPGGWMAAGSLRGDSPSLTSKLSRAWTDSDMGAWFRSIGTESTGRTDANALSKYSGFFGVEGAGNLQAKVGAMSAGYIFGNTKLKDYETAGGKIAAGLIADLATNNTEFGDASESKRFEMARDAVMGNRQLRQTAMQIASDRGVSMDEAVTALFMMGNNQAGKNRINVAEVARLPSNSFDPTAVAQRERDANKAFREEVGAEAFAEFQRNPDALDVMEQLFQGDSELRALVNKRDSKGVQEHMKAKYGREVKVDETTVGALKSALEWNDGALNKNGQSGLENLRKMKRSQQDKNVVAGKKALSELKDEVSKVKGLKGKGADTMAALVAATDKLSSSLGVDNSDVIEKNFAQFQSALDAAAEAGAGQLEAYQDSAFMTGAIARRAGVSQGLGKLAKRGRPVTAEEIQKATGLSIDEIGAATGISTKKGGKTLFSLDASVMSNLEKAVSGRAAGAALSAGTVGKPEQKEETQMDLMKKMVASLDVIAKKVDPSAFPASPQGGQLGQGDSGAKPGYTTSYSR